MTARTLTDADLAALILDVCAEGDGTDDDDDTLNTAEGYAEAYPAAAELGRHLAAGRAVHDDAGRVTLTRHAPMHDAPWHLTGEAVRPRAWQAHDTLAGACYAFAELAGLELDA